MNAVLYNGPIYPQTPIRIRSRSVALSGARILELSPDKNALLNKYPRYRHIDLKGRAVLPGFTDSHAHFYFWVISLGLVHLEETTSIAEALEKIRKYRKGLAESDWIIGDGWSFLNWREKRRPTAEELDRVTGPHPAAMFSKDQHMLWVNSRALEMAGIDKNTPDPVGGAIERDPHTRKPSGVLCEVPGYFPVIKLISGSEKKQFTTAWKKASRIAYSRGVIGFHSFDGTDGWKAFEGLHKDNRLGFRVTYYFPASMLNEVISQGIYTGQGDETLRVGGIKIFADGSLGAQTALMKKPYPGGKNCGVRVTKLSEMCRVINRANKNNLACAVHAIGDRAVADIITAYEKTGNKQLRNRIEHLQNIEPKDIKRLKNLNVIASMQPSHCPADRALIARFWGSRGRNAYVFRTLLKNNIPLAFGSDCPIEPLDPLAGIHAAVNRNAGGDRGHKFYPQEAISVRQAVYGFTVGAAYSCGREDFASDIKPGYQADLVVLEDDIHAGPPSQIYRTEVAATIFNGRIVYRNHSSRLKI